MTQTKGTNFTSVQLGHMAELKQYRFEHPRLKEPLVGKKFLKQDLGLTGMEVSLHHMPPRGAVPFYHRHTENEELYLFLSGAGEFQVDDEVIPIREGSAIRVAPAGKRTWRNNADVPMFYIVVQAKAGTLASGDVQDGRAVNEPVRWPAR